MNTKTMNKKLYFIINFFLTALLFSRKAFASFEITYPSILGITITSESTTSQIVIYLFMFLVALGAVIAFITLVFAGLRMVAGANRSEEISKAKNSFQGAFIGLMVLFCSWLILNTINKNLTVVELSPLGCSDVPICVEYKRIDPETNQIKTSIEMSIPIENDNVKLTEGEQIIIKKFPNLKEIWAFPETNFKGSGHLLYRNENYATGEANPPIPETGISIDPIYKSYRIITKSEGLYLYDESGYNVNDGTAVPFFVKQNIADFAQTKPPFFKKTASIQMESPRMAANGLSGLAPAAILFTNNNYRGECLIIDPTGIHAEAAVDFGNVSDLNGVKTTNNPNHIFGYNLASLIYFTIDLSEYANSTPEPIGEVIFYNDIDCKNNGNVRNQCVQDSFGAPYANATQSCAATGELNFQIRSFKINGPLGVVLMDDNKCQYFSSANFAAGNCIPSILESDVTNPNKFIIFPIK